VFDTPDLRAYGPADFPAVLGLIGEAFGGETPESVRFAVSASNTTTFVAQVGGRLAGVAMAIAFGRTAWLGNVVVSPTHRRRGLGFALTERALQHARKEAETVLLLALGDAQRVYERLGFVDDGLYGTWVRPDPPAAAGQSASAAHGSQVGSAQDRAAAEQCLALDRRATGEDRRAYLDHFMAVVRIAYADDAEEHAGAAAGYSARLPWGTGAIIADDPRVAASLVGDMLLAFPGTRFEFPDANEAGCRLASGLGLVRVKENLRMRLGPPVAGFRPQCIYKALTPAVG